MQAKDVPTLPILEHLAKRIRERDRKLKDPALRAKWCTHWQYEKPEDAGWCLPIPKGTPDKVALAKMDQLYRKGLVAGCNCGCRGDWVITDKGLERLEQLRAAKAA